MAEPELIFSHSKPRSPGRPAHDGGRPRLLESPSDVHYSAQRLLYAYAYRLRGSAWTFAGPLAPGASAGGSLKMCAGDGHSGDAGQSACWLRVHHQLQTNWLHLRVAATASS